MTFFKTKRKYFVKNLLILLFSISAILFLSIKILQTEMDNQNYYKIIESSKLEKSLEFNKESFVYFFKDNCSPCSKFKGILNDFIKENNIDVIAINISEATNSPFEVTDKYKIKYTPTIIFFKNSVEKERLESLPSKDDFSKFMLQNI